MLRIRVLALAITALLLAALPALATHTKVGTFTLKGPSAGTYSKTVTISWKYTGGSTMRSKFVTLSTVDASGAVKLISTVPVWWGKYHWNSTAWNDGTYRVQGVVVGTKPVIRSFKDGVALDNTAPQVAVTRPADGDVIVSDRAVSTGTSNTVVAGRVTIAADASDGGSGIAAVSLQVGDEVLEDVITSCNDAARLACEGTGEYLFPIAPKEHTVTATACDRAGNCSTSEPVTVTAATSVGTLPDVSCVAGACVPEDDVSAPGGDSGDGGDEPGEDPVTVPSAPDVACVLATSDPACLLS